MCDPAALLNKPVEYQYNGGVWYPGVVTEISDGTQVNYRGVLLPPGRHHIQFEDGDKEWVWLRITYQHKDAPGGWRPVV